MPSIFLNGETIDFNGETLADLLAAQAFQAPFAAAVNTVFVPKPQYGATVLQENDRIDIVRPVVGG